VLCLYLLGIQMINFVVAGGLEGVAESFEDGLSELDLFVNWLPQVLIPLLGVGLGLRRTRRQVLKRLGLGEPSLEGIGVAFALTIGLFVFVIGMNLVWQTAVSEETYEEQTEASDALSESIDSIWLAFLMAATAATGEEIAFRGALQPVFGFWPTAIIFALTHAQYTLTPAALIIFGVAVVFGWLRQRYNTSVAILAHFLYNFIPSALLVLIGGSEIGAANTVTNLVDHQDGTYTITYSIRVENTGDANLSDLRVMDDLAATFEGATDFVVDSVTSPDFSVNQNFDGRDDTDLLTGDDDLDLGESGTITVTVTVTPGDHPGPYLNTVTARGTDKYGTKVSDDSQNGTDVDADGDGDPNDDDEPTPISFPQEVDINAAGGIQHGQGIFAVARRLPGNAAP
jgi:uncharacterized repeat protein (TIGR01451 family)